MTAVPNPLVAAREDSTGAIDGSWIAEDIGTLVAGFRSGSWIDASIGGFAASMDALSVITDPLGSLVSMGLAWLMEHVEPLSDALDWLAGDPDQITAYGQTWSNVSAAAKESAADLRDAVARQTAGWTGAAADGYRGHAEIQRAAMLGIAEAAAGIAEIVRGAGLVVSLVRQLVRDLIAEFVSVLAVRIWEWLAEEGLTLGLATPLVVSQVGTLVGRWMAKIARLLHGLVASLRRLMPMLQKLGRLIDSLKDLLRRLLGRPGTAATDPGYWTKAFGGHSTRPRNRSDYEREERWAEAAYDAIRQHADADTIAANLRDAERLDGSRGFSREEIEQIRQHVFFEEHPLADYDGGVVHQRYDASPDMAEAWLRLRRGRPLPEDVALLEHELAESRYYRDNPGATYQEAHRAANGVSNWERQIPDPTFEDYAEPWG
ncbi:WXG100 family type VII secretion target [Micromonospora sp. NPDC049559]|uniref:WXG100 family type VII secretion target n=1 Tax=Micromonospora sp. NPDC049559 TaxID=3155923 RepID=UPI00341EF02C